MSSVRADTEDRDETADLLRESMDCVDTDRGIDKHTIIVYPGIDRDAIRRIRRLVDYDFATRATFSLSRIPTEADWDQSWFPECLTYLGTPVMIRAMGSVVGVDVAEAGDTGEEVCVRLELVRGEDHEAFVDLIRKADARKVKFPDHIHLFHRELDHRNHFDAIYDATEALRPRTVMAKMALHDVRAGDVVLAECVCERRAEPGGWTANFALISLAMLAQRAR